MTVHCKPDRAAMNDTLDTAPGVGGTLGGIAQAIGQAPTTYKAVGLASLLVFLTSILLSALPSNKSKIPKMPFWIPLEIAATPHFLFTGGIVARIL